MTDTQDEIEMSPEEYLQDILLQLKDINAHLDQLVKMLNARLP